MSDLPSNLPTSPAKPTREDHPFWQVFWTIWWGLYCSVLCFDLLLLTAILWIPALILGERRRWKRKGTRFGLLRTGIFLSIATTAVLLPVKALDQEPKTPLPNLNPTIIQIQDSFGRLFHEIPFDLRERVIHLPSRTPTLRQAFRAIEEETGLRAHCGYCGNGFSLLFGGHIMAIRFDPPDNE